MMRAALLLLVGSTALLGTASAFATVYKCAQEGGRVMYSDVPCKGGTVVDVDAGAPNAAAIARLAQDNAAFDRQMALRRAAEERAALERQQLNAQLEAAQAAQSMADAAVDDRYYYAPAYGVVPTAPRKRHKRHEHKPPTPEHRIPGSAQPPSDVRRRNQ
jgi:hypothetical protein